MLKVTGEGKDFSGSLTGGWEVKVQYTNSELWGIHALKWMWIPSEKLCGKEMLRIQLLLISQLVLAYRKTLEKYTKSWEIQTKTDCLNIDEK